jgi:hypothetical protein
MVQAIKKKKAAKRTPKKRSRERVVHHIAAGFGSFMEDAGMFFRQQELHRSRETKALESIAESLRVIADLQSTQQTTQRAQKIVVDARRIPAGPRTPYADPYRMYAAGLHGIRPEDVTPEQRKAAKLRLFAEFYVVPRRLNQTNG